MLLASVSGVNDRYCPLGGGTSIFSLGGSARAASVFANTDATTSIPSTRLNRPRMVTSRSHSNRIECSTSDYRYSLPNVSHDTNRTPTIGGVSANGRPVVPVLRENRNRK